MNEQTHTQQSKTMQSSLLLFYLLPAASFCVLYFPVIKKLIRDWNGDPNYSHGYFIPFLAGFMIWSRREGLQQAVKKPSSIGLGLILLGLMQFFAAWVGSEYFLQGTSMIMVLIGSVLYLWGWRVAALSLVPILYLVFMIPLPDIIWNRLAVPLALLASKVSADLVSGLGLTILREGNILTLPNITLQVADACSGLRSLTTLLALSAFLAFVSDLSAGRKWILFLAGAPIALLGNIFRLTGTAFLARHYGASVAHGFIHDFSGWIVFVLGLVMLLGVNAVLGRIGSPNAKHRE
ncbi:MAG: exosortase/archaeosortase family protein [Desulfohalobiaceae bacterium]|nr:exosortase/archaeosortase family protein [Desulfohalobiaceae bacterium]